MKKLTRNNIILLSIMSLAILIACNKEDETPTNPYDSVDYGTNEDNTDTLHQYDIISVHQDILKPRCATPGCHDGVFEPDFRTVQSSVQTLVYQPIIKNNAAEEFAFRVIPYDTTNSVLYERITNCCFVNQDDRMPQDNIGTGLDEELIDRIGGWIMEGAQDFTGSVITYPNTEPEFTFYTAIDNTFSVDLGTERLNDIPYESFLIDHGTDFYIVPLISDDSTSIMNLENPTLSFAMSPDGFDSPVQQVVGTPISVPGQGEFMLCRFNTNLFNVDDVVYMRFSCNDGDHAQDTEFPINSSIIEYKTFWSFKVR